jgi:hypothetical protein
MVNLLEGSMLLLLAWHNHEEGIGTSYTCDDQEVDTKYVPANSLTRCEAIVAPITVCNQGLEGEFYVKNFRKYRRRNG